MNYSKFLPLLATIFIGSWLPVNGQHIILRGIVLDSASGQLLEEATVSLFKLPASEMAERKRSDTAFTFQNLAKGYYVLITSYQGYDVDSVAFTVKAKDSGERRIIILLRQQSENLMQVVVQASIPPAIVKNDTIAFNASAYPSPPNSTVEDMLRKLPGVEIDKDGNVTMQGKKVDKITINGKDFFLNDLRTASQSLPADLVAQVEVFDTQSERVKMLGIKENGNGKTINLKLKKKYPVGFFGKLYGGFGGSDGSPGSYSFGGNATKFAGDEMFFGTANANNINNQFTGTEHQNGPGSGIQTTNNIQLNYRDACTPKLTATLNAGRLYTNSSVTETLNRTTVLGDSSIVQNSSSVSQNKVTDYSANAAFEYKIDSVTQLNLHSNYTNAQGRNANSDTVAIQTIKNRDSLSGNPSSYQSSIGKTANNSSNNANTVNNIIDFSHQFKKKGRFLYLNLGQSSSSQNQPASLYSLIRNFDSAGNSLSNTIVNQQSTQKTTNNGYSINTSYTEPVGKTHILDFNYSLSHASGYSDKKSFDYDSLSGKYDTPDSLTTNRFLNHNTVQSFSAGYNTTEGKYRFQIGLTAQLTQLDNVNLVSNKDLRQQEFNLIPRASLLWEIKKEKNILISYFQFNQLPTTDQLQPIPDLTNPYLIKVGNPDLKQQLTHIVSARYSDFNSKTFRNWQVLINADYAQNAITSASTVLQGGLQELEYVNVAGVYHLSALLTYGFPLGGQKNGNASLSMHGNAGHDISLINGAINASQNTGTGAAANVNFHTRDKLFIDAKADINQTSSHYSLPGSSSSATLNENYNLNVTYRLPWTVSVSSYYDLQVVGSQDNLPSHAVSLWNGSLSKSILNNHCEFRLSAFDLLNSSNSFTQSLGVNYVQTQKMNLPGRLFLCSVIYRFRKTEG